MGTTVIFDATHSVRRPPDDERLIHQRAAQRVPVLARAAVAVGVAGVFIETHPDPRQGASNGPKHR